MAGIENCFRLKERGSSVRTEVLAGCTTFLTVSYIIFVNPLVLAGAGMDSGAVLAATCLAAAFGCAVMGLYANYPIALAPGMGLNAYFAAVAVGTLGLSWQVALGAVFCSGFLMLILSVLPAHLHSGRGPGGLGRGGAGGRPDRPDSPGRGGTLPGRPRLRAGGDGDPGLRHGDRPRVHLLYAHQGAGGRRRELHPAVVAVAVLFAIRFAV